MIVRLHPESFSLRCVAPEVGIEMLWWSRLIMDLRPYIFLNGQLTTKTSILVLNGLDLRS